MNLSFTPYKERPIKFLELWTCGEWRLKVYGISFNRAEPERALVTRAKTLAAERIEASSNATEHYSAGFLGVHEGRTSNFVFVGWWANENELYHHVYVSPLDAPGQFTYQTSSGLTACVWDLRVMAFERQAWIDHMLKKSGSPDLEAYPRRKTGRDYLKNSNVGSTSKTARQ